MVYAVIPELFAKYLSKQSIVYLVLVSSHGHSWNEVVGFLFGFKGGRNQKSISLNRRSYTVILCTKPFYDSSPVSNDFPSFTAVSPWSLLLPVHPLYVGTEWLILASFFFNCWRHGLCWPGDLKDSKVMCSRVKRSSHSWAQEVSGLFLISPSYVFICKHPPPSSKCQRENFFSYSFSFGLP